MTATFYTPKVNDYVKWGNIEGWIYWIDEQSTYLTIEISVKPKDEENLRHCSLHRKIHCLIVCYQSDWPKLVYVKSRKSVHDDEVQSGISTT